MQGETSDQFAPPAVCHALPPLSKITGQKNIGQVWEGEVLEHRGKDPGAVYRCVVKLLDPETTLPVELACSLVGSTLGNHIPMPVLVWADRSDLPELPSHIASDQVLLFGCAFVNQDVFFEQLSGLETDHTLNNAVWNSYCAGADLASKGASLDELIANYDRHFRNLRYDGSKWWMIDHDSALKQTHHKDTAAMDAGFKSHKNQIASQLKERRPNDHDMPNTARKVKEKQQQIAAMSAVAAKWASDDPQLQALWTRTAALLALIARRMPMVELMINERIGANVSTSLQWTQTPPT